MSGESKDIEPEIMAQVLSRRKGRKTGQPASRSPQDQQESHPEGKDLVSGEEGAHFSDLPDLAQLQGAGEPSREDLCQGQRTWPTLESLRQQAERQAQDDVSGTHRVYWDEGQ